MEQHNQEPSKNNNISDFADSGLVGAGENLEQSKLGKYQIMVLLAENITWGDNAHKYTCPSMWAYFLF